MFVFSSFLNQTIGDVFGKGLEIVPFDATFAHMWVKIFLTHAVYIFIRGVAILQICGVVYILVFKFGVSRTTQMTLCTVPERLIPWMPYCLSLNAATGTEPEVIHGVTQSKKLHSSLNK